MTEELLKRIQDTEDQFVERKLEGGGSSVFKKTIVAFANSVPPNRTGVLFVGVADDGTVKGVSNPDNLQRTLRLLAEKECYPPIYVDLEVVSISEGIVLAVVVSYSAHRPHFSGAAYVRRGSESVVATPELYRELLVSQDDKRRFLLDNRSETWTVELLNKPPGESSPLFDTRARTTIESTVEDVTSFYVRFLDLGSGRKFTEMLNDIHISFDDKKQRPRAVIWPVGRI